MNDCPCEEYGKALAQVKSLLDSLQQIYEIVEYKMDDVYAMPEYVAMISDIARDALEPEWITGTTTLNTTD